MLPILNGMGSHEKLKVKESTKRRIARSLQKRFSDLRLNSYSTQLTLANRAAVP